MTKLRFVLMLSITTSICAGAALANPFGFNPKEAIRKANEQFKAPLIQLAAAEGGQKTPVFCGVLGSIEERIEDCQDKLGTFSRKTVSSDSNSTVWGFTDWRLVTLTEGSMQVWRDEKTKLIWSDISTSTCLNWKEAVSYCIDPRKGQGPKGNLDLEYELPSTDQYHVAYGHGIAKVVPKLYVDGKFCGFSGGVQTSFWTSSSARHDTEARYFSHRNGPSTRLSLSKTFRKAVRCVARSQP